MNAAASGTLAVPAPALVAFAVATLEGCGLPPPDAARTAGLIVEADLFGIDTHGVFRLPAYVKRLRDGGINTTPSIGILRDRPAAALVDGDNGMGHLVMARAAEIGIAKAKATGAAWIGVRMSNHAGPAALYARMALPHDMIGLYMAMGNANHMPPHGGAEGLLCTNPLAVAVPAGAEPPVVLDMATTTVAFGKVKAAAERGETLPEGWMVDHDGSPLTDAVRAMREGGLLLPFGGYKGYALSLIISLLAGTLNAAPVGRDIVDWYKDETTPTNTGQALLFIDIGSFCDVAVFKRQVDAFVRDIRGSRRAPGVERIWLPGEQSHDRRRTREREGIPLPAALIAKLDATAASVGRPPIAAYQESAA